MKEMLQDALKSKLNYDSNTGVFTWREGGSVYMKEGTVAGNVLKCGIRIVRIGGVSYEAGRLAYLYEWGILPEGVVHINGRLGDNRLQHIKPSTVMVDNEGYTKYKSAAVIGNCVKYKGAWYTSPMLGGLPHGMNVALVAPATRPTEKLLVHPVTTNQKDYFWVRYTEK